MQRCGRERGMMGRKVLQYAIHNDTIPAGKEVRKMASKSANIMARVEPDVKKQAEEILSSLGVSTSGAITMFYKQIILRKGLPFEVVLPDERKPLDMSKMTQTEIDQILKDAINGAKTGKTRLAQDVFDDIRKEYGI